MPDLHHKAISHRPPGGHGTRIVKITPNDDIVYDPPLRAIWIAAPGDLTIVALDDDEPVTLTAVPMADVLDFVYIKRVMATGTTIKMLYGIY